MSTKGYLRPSILWHLMEEGTATQADLVRLIGSPRDYVRRQLLVMQTLGQVQHSPTPGAYSLTQVGIEAALQIRSQQVEFA